MNQPSQCARRTRHVVMMLCSAWVLACSSTKSEAGAAGAGGSSANAAGGSANPSGGSAAASGGAIAMGGGVATGGAVAAGGTAASAGASAANGGSIDAAGGTTTGGASNGGASPAKGGNVNSGGASSGGGGSAGNGAHGSGASTQWNTTLPKFTKHTIASFSAGYATVIADIDHDGLPDVVALSSGSAGLVWFKNPSWKKYTVTTTAKQLIFMAPYDVDGDGDLDLAFVSDFDMNNTTSGGTVSWAEAPSDPTQSQEWQLHPIDAIPTSHRLRFADIDGDGKKELIDLPLFGEGSTGTAHAGAVQLKAYTIPSDPKGKWTSKVLDDMHLEVAHGIEIVDWDGDKAEDILTAANDGIDLFRPSLGSSAQHLGAGAMGQAPNRGSSEVALGSLGGARFVASIEPWHGTDAVIYTPGASASDLWTRTVLGSDFEHGHGMVAADLNGDGFDEVVGGGGQGAMAQYIYRYVPSSKTWDKIELDVGGVAVSGIDAADMNGDGAIDIVSIGGSPTNNVVWYESTK